MSRQGPNGRGGILLCGWPCRPTYVRDGGGREPPTAVYKVRAAVADVDDVPTW